MWQEDNLPKLYPQNNNGWICPKCGGVYAPSTPSCFQCTPKKDFDYSKLKGTAG